MKALHFIHEDENHLPYVNVGEPVWRVWRKMKRLQSPYMVVVNGHALVGVVKERDVRMVSQIHGGESADVTEAMIPNPPLFSANSSIRDVFSELLCRSLDFIIVTDQDQRPLKVITVHELFRHIFPQTNPKEWGLLKELLENNGQV